MDPRLTQKMALHQKFIVFRKPPDGLLEISERVFVFNSCFSTNVLEEDEYKTYVESIVAQLREYAPDASFMAYNFGEGERPSRLGKILSSHDMRVIDYPSEYEGCPLLTMEMIHHVLRSSDGWLSPPPKANILLMHCEREGWPVLAFMLASLLIYLKDSTDEQKTLEMTYKQAPIQLLQMFTPLNPMPSQLRYLQYVSRRNVCSNWPPLVRSITLECVILRNLPVFNGEKGCRPIFRIYGLDLFIASDQSPKVLHSTPKKSRTARFYNQAECELVKIDIRCHVQGDVVLECINMSDDQESEQMIFRIMFNTAFIRSNILILTLDDIDITWNARDCFSEEFRAEVLLSELDVNNFSMATMDLEVYEGKEGLSAEAFSRVQEIFSNVDWLGTQDDLLQAVEQRSFPNSSQASPVKWKSMLSAQQAVVAKGAEQSYTLEQDPLYLQSVQRKGIPITSEIRNLQKKCLPEAANLRPAEQTVKLPQSPSLSKGHHSEEISKITSLLSSPKSNPTLSRPSKDSKSSPRLAFQNLSDSELSITSASWLPVVQLASLAVSSCSASRACPPTPPPPPPPLSPSNLASHSPSLLNSHAPLRINVPSSNIDSNFARPLTHPLPFLSSQSFPIRKKKNDFFYSPSLSYSGSIQNLNASKIPAPPPPPSISYSSTNYSPAELSQSKSKFKLPIHPENLKKSEPKLKSTRPPPPPPPTIYLNKPEAKSKIPPETPPLPPPLPPLSSHLKNSEAKSKSTHPPPPPPPPTVHLNKPGGKSQLSSGPPPPPPPPSHLAEAKPGLPPPPPPPLRPGSTHPPSASSVPPPPPPNMKGRGLTKNPISSQPTMKKSTLKPLHWVKVTRAMKGSLWAESHKHDEHHKAPEFDISELESLFSAAVSSKKSGGSSEKTGKHASRGPKTEKVNLIDIRRAQNCGIMLTKIKMPLPDLMNSVLSLDDSVLDADQVENLIKSCPTKDEMELLRGFKGDKENLGKCEKFFLEVMKVPRMESKMRVFSFKIQFRSQVDDLRKNLLIVNSAAEEIRSSIKLKRIMQAILSLGNALNQGTARGSAVGFRLDSLLKLNDTRARNNQMTLMHYLCKVIADKMPELLDFEKDLVSLENASKVQLKTLAEEMQAISKGLGKVEEELTLSENDGPVSQIFYKTLKNFIVSAEGEVRSLTSLYSGAGKNADALAHYFGEDPARCPFEQVVSTLKKFVRLFIQAHEANIKKIELERKKAEKESQDGKVKSSSPRRTPENILEQLPQSPLRS